MRYLLDTNVCVMYLNGRSDSVRSRILSTPSQDLAVCSVVKAELFYGAMRSNNQARTLERQQQFLDRFISLPFNDEAAIVFGEIRAHLANAGTPIGAYDLQIAAIAIANDIILVTHNTREFSRVAGLPIEDWEVDKSDKLS
ncbi:type II toxin-antitoxin system tRNA(fMet)-specific endonuclease VapC [Chamaesiphon minutus]|uniref:Ribonuclease VapC n=1 Tax=Chamaesiphon minutus (strain ATCC 27169 / PCC 6605) TaxID=1173020 RepID=K9UG13_CHAP6|nr:PIN domain-containing protein [Chamaesiphon minutus]AFY93750.1 putative nucleic acid-binding protein, contains PIN domain [Chamaesiphon minutus PCC 6605]